MEYREDITDFIMKSLKIDKRFKSDYVAYSQDGFLFNVVEKGNKISHYNGYNLYQIRTISKDIEDKFNIKFDSSLICKCGTKDCFSARYGEYELLLTCNSCGNDFSAYSG